MRRLLIVLFLCVLAGGPALQADTLKLKNGRVVKGRVTQFKNGEFTVEVSPGERVLLLQESVESIEFEAAPAAAPAAASAAGGVGAGKTGGLASRPEGDGTGPPAPK